MEKNPDSTKKLRRLSDPASAIRLNTAQLRILFYCISQKTQLFKAGDEWLSLNLARAISDASWGKFYKFLRYKCEWLGKCFVKINRFYPSSKLRDSCRHKQDMPLKVRVFDCESCDLAMDRDIKASINTRAAGLADFKAYGAIA